MNYIKLKKSPCNCLECGTAVYGRADKKFCSTSCKNRHNNKKRDVNKTRKPILSTIENNYQLLDFIVRSGCTYINLEDLKQMGFDPSYVTAQLSGDKGHREFRCFDIRYYQSATKIFKIRRIEEEI